MTACRCYAGDGAARGSRQDAEASNADEEAAQESEEDADDTQLQEMVSCHCHFSSAEQVSRLHKHSSSRSTPAVQLYRHWWVL